MTAPLTYMLTLEPRPGEEDITLEHDGLRIVVDRESAFLVEGAEALMASDRMEPTVASP